MDMDMDMDMDMLLVYLTSNICDGSTEHTGHSLVHRPSTEQSGIRRDTAMALAKSLVRDHIRQ